MIRKCNRCGVKKDLTLFPKNKNCREGRASTCKACAYELARARAPYDPEYRRAYYLANKERENANAKKHYAENKESYEIRRKKWQKDNREKVRMYTSKNYWKSKEELSDAFVKHLLTSSPIKGLTSKKIMPPELVEAKRLQILLRRELNK